MITPTKEFWDVFKTTNGALSTAEAICIMNIAAQAPEANRSVEFGVFRGKSAMSAIYSLKMSLFYLVEPEFKDDEWGGEVYKKVVQFAGNGSSVITYAMTSIDWLNDNEREFGYVFIDSGSHSDDLPMQEVKAIEDRIVPNGIVSFHDKGSQFTKVDEAYNYLLSTGKYEEIKIDWQEIFDYVVEHNLEEGNNSWHLYPELPHPPNFVGALRRK